MSCLRHIYLDNAATTKPEPAVVEAICHAMLEFSRNPSSAYSAAGNARAALRQSKVSLSAMLGVTPQELFFTGGGTEANNWALHQAAGKHVVLSSIEHSSVLLAARNQGCRVTLVSPEPDGVVSPAAVEAAICPDTALISVQLANNETGALQPVEAIGQLAQSRRILFHCDGVQGFGQLPIDPHACHIDLLSASAHKLYGPRGVGFLYIRQGIVVLPLLAGGGQENGRRAGTENISAIHGFRVAAELAARDMTERATRQEALRCQLVQGLLNSGCGAVELTTVSRVPSITALLLPNMESEEMLSRLDMRGIEISGGAACAAQSGQPSHVYTAMGLSDKQARRVIRISTGRHTTPEEISAVVTDITQILEH